MKKEFKDAVCREALELKNEFKDIVTKAPRRFFIPVIALWAGAKVAGKTFWAEFNKK